MTVSDVKQWLKSYKHIQREIRDIELRITQLRLKYAAPSAISYSDMPKAHNNTDLSDYMTKLEEYEQLLISKHTHCLGLSVQYIQACDMLTFEEAHVIKRRYLDGASWVQIASEIPCAERTVYYIHGRALNHLVNVCSSLQIIL
jgi:DNA-directed RNA polymerase specialized sigma subunit